MALTRLTLEAMGPVNPIGGLCFDDKLKTVTFRGEHAKLSDAALRACWSLMNAPAGVRKDDLVQLAWHKATLNNLHRAIHDVRKIVTTAGVLEEKELYRFNIVLLGALPKGPVKHEEWIERLLDEGFLPMDEFIDLLFEARLNTGLSAWSETFICAPDAMELLRSNRAKFAAAIASQRAFFLATAPSSVDRIPTTLAILYQAVREAEPDAKCDAFDKLRAALTIVITDRPAEPYYRPVYYLNSHDPERCMLFELRQSRNDAAFMEHADKASGPSDSLRASFHNLDGQGLICTPGGLPDGDPLRTRLKEGIARAFHRFADPRIVVKAQATFLEPSNRIQAQSELKSSMAASAAGD